MALRSDPVGIVADAKDASLAFYCRLGLDVPDGTADETYVETHVEALTAGGLRVARDTAGLIGQIGPSWTEPVGGHRISLDFRCPSPADVDAEYA